MDDEFTQEPALLEHLSAAFEAVWERAVPHEHYRI
jgi:hypothetical protein